MIKLQFKSGSPHKLGATSDEGGTNFAVFSAHATKIDLCIFAEDGASEISRQSLPEHTGPIWHGYAQGLEPGTLYGFRAHGSYVPDQGHRFNPNKLLLDPYTRELRGSWSNHSSMLGYDAKSPTVDLSFSSRDSAPFVPKSVVADSTIFGTQEGRPNRAWDETVIYEAHVKGLTQELPNVPDTARGTYEALASDAVLEHLHKLGISAIELLPVHSFIDDGFLKEKSLTNYWGYNSIGFFAPEPRYFGSLGFAGFRQMVRKFHAAGIEVILDVVYNHTAEGSQLGPTLCYRGLDNASYYRLIAGQPRYYVNDTGCGNTLNISNPYVLRLVMDSLRFWVEQMGVDGFRFDLATTLAREDHGFDQSGGFLKAIRQDPVLGSVKLIAEPWDIGPGGYRLGEFPHEFAEWNDGFRDSVRRFWRGDVHSAQDLGTQLLGSAGKFDQKGRRVWSSLNFLSAHDGFTLADTVSYNERHNLANGENNRDGHDSNFSNNCGAEGPSEDPDVKSCRARRQRNMLATLLLSQGTPMLLAGDEIGNSQSGNNNAYCQDNPIGWINWEKADENLTEFVAALIAFRAAHRSLRQSRFLHGAARPSDGLPDVEWLNFQGEPLNWRDSSLSKICLLIRCSAEEPVFEPDCDVVFLVFNREDQPAEVILPVAPAEEYWIRAIDTAICAPLVTHRENKPAASVDAQSIVAFVMSNL